MAEKEFGIGLIGAGDVVQGKHLPALKETPGGRLRAVYDKDAGRARALADKWGVAKVCSSLEELVSDPAVQAVLVATPNAFHREGAEAAARAGKHVLCEKPLAITLADSRAIIESCRKQGVKLQVGFHHRFQPQFRLAREILASGILGRVYSFQATCSEPLELIPGAENYRFDQARSGGLTLMDIGTHRLDMLVCLLGPMVAVSAAFGSVAARAGGPHALEDNAVLLLESAAGALGSLGAHRFSRAAMTGNILHAERGLLCFSTDIVNPYQAAPLAVYVEEPFERWPELLRRRYYGPVWWERPDRGWVSMMPAKVDCYRAEWEAFREAIQNDTPTAVPGEESLHILEIVLAAYEAFRTGRRVALPLPPDFAAEAPRFSR